MKQDCIQLELDIPGYLTLYKPKTFKYKVVQVTTYLKPDQNQTDNMIIQLQQIEEIIQMLKYNCSKDNKLNKI